MKGMARGCACMYGVCHSGVLQPYLLIDWPFISPWQFTQEGLTFGRSLALY
eukprot:COSAG01_NODE_942_length_12551_cov_47.129216_12_plen_51_part_00